MGNISQKKQGSNNTSLRRFTVGALPLIDRIAKRMKLREQLAAYIPGHGNDLISPVDTLLLLIYNLAIGKSPLYELDQWCASMDLQRIGIARQRKKPGIFNDDRFGKALDKLFDADRASLMTSLVTSYVSAFDVDLGEIHNDSTTVKAYGRMDGRTETGFELKKGHSKDHRPDLKQLVYTLTVSADGGVPIHHHCYPGNYTDDKTHIDTWKILRKITGRPDFLYVADAKLCTDEQLNFIAKNENGGRAITIIPETWGEVQQFKEELRRAPKVRSIIWRRFRPNSETETEYFSVFKGTHTTVKRGYRIYWIYSSEKKKRDRIARETALESAEAELTSLNARLNTRKLKTPQEIISAKKAVIDRYGVKNLLKTELLSKVQKSHKQQGKGRPSKETVYTTLTTTVYTIAWRRDREAINQDTRLDGIFPLLSTDASLKAVEVLKAYKYQPRLEKRFSQFKTVHNAAPLLFKKIERIEANMFAFFIALALQALLEREIRLNMNTAEIEKLYIYPEDRECKRPTTSIIFDRFSQLSRYVMQKKGAPDCHFQDQLSQAQNEILAVLKMSHDEYWQANMVN
jgi:transposase